MLRKPPKGQPLNPTALDTPPPAPKKRGRPRKHPLPCPDASTTALQATPLTAALHALTIHLDNNDKAAESDASDESEQLTTRFATPRGGWRVGDVPIPDIPLDSLLLHAHARGLQPAGELLGAAAIDHEVIMSLNAGVAPPTPRQRMLLRHAVLEFFDSPFMRDKALTASIPGWVRAGGVDSGVAMHLLLLPLGNHYCK